MKNFFVIECAYHLTGDNTIECYKNFDNARKAFTALLKAQFIDDGTRYQDFRITFKNKDLDIEREFEDLEECQEFILKNAKNISYVWYDTGDIFGHFSLGNAKFED